MKKKAVEWHFLVLGIIAIITMIIVIFGFKNLFGKEATNTGLQIDNTKDDFDCDGVMNLFDRCCATDQALTSKVKLDGCAPTGDKVIKCDPNKKTC